MDSLFDPAVTDPGDAFFRSIPLGVIIQDDSGAIIAANPAAERILGLSFAEMRGATSADPRWDVIHEDGSRFPPEEHPASRSLRTGEVTSSVVMGVFNPYRKGRVWLSVSAIPLARNGRKQGAVHVVFEDITIRKYWELINRHQQEVLRLVVTGEALDRILDAIVLGIEAINPVMICSTLLLDEQKKTSAARLGPSPARRLQRGDSWHADRRWPRILRDRRGIGSASGRRQYPDPPVLG